MTEYECPTFEALFDEPNTEGNCPYCASDLHDSDHLVGDGGDDQ